MKKPDYFLTGTVAALIFLGLIILTSVSSAISQQKFGSPNFYLLHHLIYGLMPGILLGFIAYKIPLARVKKWAPFLLLFNLLLLILVFVPKIGLTLGGARSWINLGFTSFQPSEILKLTFVLYVASWLAIRTPHQSKLGAGQTEKMLSRTLIPFAVIIGLIAILLIFQPDVGTLGIIVIIGTLMYFLAGTPWKHVFLIAGAVIVFLAIAIKISPYRFNRFLVFINSDIDPMGIGYQIKQALIAVGSGGIFGRGAGMSVQKFGLLPQPMADSIFACFSEEWGFVGSIILITLFLMFAWRGFMIARNTTDKFLQLTALGITSWFSLQSFVNIASMVGILPLTGIPLPFISYGGSALVTGLIGVGLLLNISKNG